MAVNGTRCDIVLQEFSDIQSCIKDLNRITEELRELMRVSQVYEVFEDPINMIDDAADDMAWTLWNDFYNVPQFMERRFGEE